MVWMWWHLKLLKQGGHAHVIDGVKGTSLGELALLCPACPYLFYNIPDNWRKAPKESGYVEEAILYFFLTRSFQILVLSINRD